MTNSQRNRSVSSWRGQSEQCFLSAKSLYTNGDYRGATNRAYYAAYSSATAISIKHGDEIKFPPEWGNPSHDQLPDLIRNNGDLSFVKRRQVSRNLIGLRADRETADYRPHRTIDSTTAQTALLLSQAVLELLEEP